MLIITITYTVWCARHRAHHECRRSYARPYPITYRGARMMLVRDGHAEDPEVTNIETAIFAKR